MPRRFHNKAFSFEVPASSPGELEERSQELEEALVTTAEIVRSRWEAVDTLGRKGKKK